MSSAILVRLPEDFEAGLFEVFTPYENLGLGYVAAVLREAEHSVTILDVVALPDELGKWEVVKISFAQQIMDANPDLIGLSLFSSMTYGHVTEFTAHLRELGYTGVIIAGGEQASLYADDVLTRIPGMDACVKGEGEFVSLDLLERLDDRNRWSEVASLVWRNENRIVHNCGRRMIPNLDILPFPSRDHLPAILAKGGETVISGSRGCPCKCSFCSIVEFFDRTLGEAWRGRCPKGIVDEIKYLYTTYGADRFWFVDDQFFFKGRKGQERAEEFFRLLEAARLPIRFDIFSRAGSMVESGERGSIELAVESGLRRAFIGIESGSKAGLALYKKGTTPEMNRGAIEAAEPREVDVLVEFIMFNHLTTLEDINDNLSLLTTVPRGAKGRLGKHDPMILGSRLYVHRETPLGQTFRQKWPELVDEANGMGDDFFIPYKFACPRVGKLYEIVSESFNAFASIEGLIEQLYRLVDRFWLPSWSDRVDASEVREIGEHYAEVLDHLKSLRSNEALRLFQETFDFVEDYNLELPDASESFGSEATDLASRMADEAKNVAVYVAAVAMAAIEECWEVLSQRNLLGPRIQRPLKGGDDK